MSCNTPLFLIFVGDIAKKWGSSRIRKVRKVRRRKDMKVIEDNRFIVSVRVGPKGQITIPVQGRKMFDIKEGDTLMVMGDKKRGLALLKTDLFYEIMEQGEKK